MRSVGIICYLHTDEPGGFDDLHGRVPADPVYVRSVDGQQRLRIVGECLAGVERLDVVQVARAALAEVGRVDLAEVLVADVDPSGNLTGTLRLTRQSRCLGDEERALIDRACRMAMLAVDSGAAHRGRRVIQWPYPDDSCGSKCLDCGATSLPVPRYSLIDINDPMYRLVHEPGCPSGS